MFKLGRQELFFFPGLALQGSMHARRGDSFPSMHASLYICDLALGMSITLSRFWNAFCSIPSSEYYVFES